MSKLKDTKNKLKSKIEAIKKINDDPSKNLADNIYDTYLKDLPTTEKLFGKKLDDFLEKRRNQIDNKSNIFGDIMEIADSILSGNSSTDKNRKPIPEKLFSKKRLKFHAQTACDKTLTQSKEIILDSVKKHFFAADGICGTNQTISVDSLKIKPGEFDFLNMFTVDPSSATGQIVYEPTTGSTPSKTKVNKELYDSIPQSKMNYNVEFDFFIFDAFAFQLP